MFKLLRRSFPFFLILLVVIGLILWVTPQGRTAVKTALFLPQVLPEISIKPQKWVTSDPVWDVVTYPKGDGLGTADLYLPSGSGKHRAELIFLGVVADPPRKDPRVVDLAEGLARSGMVVFIP